MFCRSWLPACLLSLAVTVPANTSVASPGVRGIYVLSNNSHPLPAGVLQHPDLTGVSLRTNWAEVQAVPGEFRWSFDQEIARARASGKKVMLRISAGVKTPAWVYRAGAASFSFTETDSFKKSEGNRLQIPIPWDPVYLDQWSRFIQAMGKKYASEESVVLVHMAGPANVGAELHLPKSKEDRQHWAQVGYTPRRLAAAWKTVIDAYAEAFPNKALALNLTVPITDDGALELILNYARQRLGARLHVQHNALSARTTLNWKVQRLVSASAGSGTVGFQLLCPVTPQGRFNDEGRRFGGTLDTAFQIGIRAGASYFEIYPVDLRTATTAQAIHELAQQLRR